METKSLIGMLYSVKTMKENNTGMIGKDHIWNVTILHVKLH